MSLVYQEQLPNEQWDTMSIEVSNDSVDIDVPDLGRVQMSHEDFDTLYSKVIMYRKGCQFLNQDIK